MHSESFGDGGAGNIGVHNGGMISLFLHGGGHKGGDQGFPHASFAADYRDDIFNAGHFMGLLKKAFGIPIIAGFLAGGAIMAAVFTHLIDSFHMCLVLLRYPGIWPGYRNNRL